MKINTIGMEKKTAEAILSMQKDTLKIENNIKQNTKDVTLAPNSGLKIFKQQITMGTPSVITTETTNSVTSNTHTHSIGKNPNFTNVNCNILTTSIIKPPSDSVTAIQITKADGATTIMNIDTSNGRIGIGTATPLEILDINSNSDADIKLYTYAAGERSSIFMGRARGSQGAEVIVNDTDVCGSIIGKGYDGASFQDVADIEFSIDGTPGAGDTPGKISFKVSPDGSNILAEVMTIKNDGKIGINTTVPASKLNILTSGTAFTTTGSDTPLDVTIEAPDRLLSNNLGHLTVWTNDAVASDKGGSIAFGGRYSGTKNATWAIIKGIKVNSTTDEYDGHLLFATRDSGGNCTEKMRINSDGKVGIGTTAPKGQLSLSSNGTAQVVIEQKTGTNQLHLKTTDGSANIAQRLFISGATNSPTYNFQTGAAGAEITTVYIDAANSRMGIGTTDFDGTPAIGQLIVKGTSTDGSTYIFVGRDSAEVNVILIDTNGVITPGGYESSDGSAGITATITTAKLTAGGANGSMTFKDGILTAQTQAT